MSENPLHLHYTNQSLQYTTQFIASMSEEEVVLDCGSIVAAANQAGQQQLPIHTRMALPWSAVNRLHRLLGELIESRETSQQTPPARASLPPLALGDANASRPTYPSQPTPS